MNDGIMPEKIGSSASPNDGRLSGLVTLFTRLIADKGNFTANGELIINQTTAESIHVLIRAEQTKYLVGPCPRRPQRIRSDVRVQQVKVGHGQWFQEGGTNPHALAVGQYENGKTGRICSFVFCEQRVS